jgi:hypothetical protein
MGLFWDLIQHGQIRDAHDRSNSLEQRVEWLERELTNTNEALVRLLQHLEVKFGEDIDGDGQVG